MKFKLPKISSFSLLPPKTIVGIVAALILVSVLSYQALTLSQKASKLEAERSDSSAELESIKTELDTLKSQDQKIGRAHV